MTIYSLWIVGRNGGLLYSRDIASMAPVDFNDKLRLASSWFGMCGISAQLSPQTDSSGIELLQTDTFDLYSFQTLTGTTFMMLTAPNCSSCRSILEDGVYRVFCDYVLKNPFYEADQVIKSDLFDKNLVAVLQEYNARVVQ
eukprot:jgi/Picsp_1/6096/NSC_03450-R1_trafficking protein particle complex subunit